jgi:hypothetical protein
LHDDRAVPTPTKDTKTMATERQIAANLANSAHSTGPKSNEGKARSSLNALRHGLAATTTAALIAADSDRQLVEERKSQWLDSFRPVGDDQEWQFEGLVVDSIRIERCRDAFFALCRQFGERARVQWDADRRRDAADLASALHHNPVAMAGKLESTLQGSDLKITFWKGLASHLDRHGDWSDPQRSLALDLLGIHKSLHDAETPVDPAEGDVVAARRAVVAAEIARLTDLRDGVLVDLDAGERAMAEQTLGAEFTKPLQLIYRYEMAACRRFDAASKKLQAAATPVAKAPAAPPKPITPPPPQFIAALQAVAAMQQTPAVAAPPSRPAVAVAPQPKMNRLQRRTLAAQQRRA